MRQRCRGCYDYSVVRRECQRSSVVEQRFRKPQVGGSNPPVGSILATKSGVSLNFPPLIPLSETVSPKLSADVSPLISRQGFGRRT